MTVGVGSHEKQELLNQVAATAVSIALIMRKQRCSPNTVLPLHDFMRLLARQKRMDELMEEYGEPDEAYLKARFGEPNTR